MHATSIKKCSPNIVFENVNQTSEPYFDCTLRMIKIQVVLLSTGRRNQDRDLLRPGLVKQNICHLITNTAVSSSCDCFMCLYSSDPPESLIFLIFYFALTAAVFFLFFWPLQVFVQQLWFHTVSSRGRPASAHVEVMTQFAFTFLRSDVEEQ